MNLWEGGKVVNQGMLTSLLVGATELERLQLEVHFMPIMNAVPETYAGLEHPSGYAESPGVIPGGHAG